MNDNTQTVTILAVLALLAISGPAHSDQAADDNLRVLMENQRNIIRLRKEELEFKKELQKAQAKQRAEPSPALEAEILDIKDSLQVADVVIKNISADVAKEKLKLVMETKSSTPSALDIALNKAIKSNLPELLKNLSQNEAARKEVIRLRSILKQQTLVRAKSPSTSTSVSLAGDQLIAEEEFLRLLSLFSGGNSDEAEDKLIRISGLIDKQPYVEEEILSYLGHDQYYIETTVHQGKMTFTIDDRPWHLEVEKSENNSIYIIIYDLTDAQEPRLVMFNKSLLIE